MSNGELIEDYFEVMARASDGLDRYAMQRAIDLIYDAWRNGGTVFTMGNGGSHSSASHFACDLAKFTIAPGKPRLKALCVGDNPSLVSAWTNDDGFGTVFAEQLEPWLTERDVVIGLSVHGGSGEGNAGAWSQNLPRAMALAKERGAGTIGIAGFGGGEICRQADVPIVIPIDNEPWGTPLIESFHLVVHHLLCLALKQRIAATPVE